MISSMKAEGGQSMKAEGGQTMLMSWRSFMPLALRSICAKVCNSLGSTSHFMRRPMLRSFGLELMRRRAEIWSSKNQSQDQSGCDMQW